jgi:hypothetical protein
MLAWAAGFTVVPLLANPLAGSNEQRIENIVLAILIGGFIGFVRTARWRGEFVYIVAIGQAARGARTGPILLAVVGFVAELGAWLLARPPTPIAILFSWKWWIGSMIVTGSLAGSEFLAEKKPGEVLPYARKAAAGFFVGMAGALIHWLVSYTGPKPWQLTELTPIGRAIGSAAVAGGGAGALLALIDEAVRRQLTRMRGVATIGGDTGKFIAATKALSWLVHGVVLLGVGAWLLSAEPLPGFSDIVGWCVILIGAFALMKAAWAFALALQTSSLPRNQAVHGDARDATEGEAQQATSGDGRSSVDGRRVPD